MTPSITAAFGRSSLFRNLSDAARVQLAEIGSERSWQEGTELFSKGDPSDSLLVVLEGRISIRELTADGRSLTLAFFGPGDVFGEMGVIDGRPRSADAVADLKSAALSIPRQRFLAYLEAQPTLAIQLLQLICARLRDTNDLVEGMAFQSVRSRIARRLVALSQGRTVNEGAARQIDLRITGQELASYCALTRETVSKQLAHWREQGTLEITRGRIVIHKLSVLEEAAFGSD